MTDAEQLGRLGNLVAYRITAATSNVQAERDITLDGKMRKEGIILRHVSDVATAWLKAGNAAAVNVNLA